LKIGKKHRQYGGSGATSGLSSSLAFTPVQGLELTNPDVQKMKQTSDKYFGVSTFAHINKSS